jgi:uncharacterized membrane protein
MTSETTVVEARGRLLWLDGFRGAAAVLMIETHVVNTFLDQRLRNAGWFGGLNYANGLVAPSFLFIAGFALGLAMRRGSGRPVLIGHKVRRLSEILVLGYLLHFPWVELLQKRWDDALRIGSQMDVLPCIAIALAISTAIEWVAQHVSDRLREWLWTGTLAILSALAVLCAPLLQSWHSGPAPLVASVNHTTGSLFPLLPWAAFVFAGALRGSSGKMGWRFSIGWLGIGLLAAWVRGHTEFSPLTPAFFLERLAWVLLLAEACQRVARWDGRVLTRLAGRESLVMYVGHLIIITLVVSAGVHESRLNFRALALVFFGVLISTFALAACNSWWRGRHARRLGITNGGP